MSSAPKPSNRPLAIVTGASGGIGEEFARRLAQNGYDLALVARSHARLEKLAGDLRRQYHARVQVLAVDLSHPAGPRRVVDLLADQASEVVVLINNAGYGVAGDFARMPETEIAGQMQVNMMAVAELSRRLLPGMLARKSGRILNVGSTAAFQPGPGMAIYFATKAFVLSFSEALASELRGTGVTVTCLCPGPVATGFAARADVGKSRLFRGGGMSVTRCVDVGYKALFKGRRVVIPGVMNWLLAFSVRFTPRRWVTWATKKLMERPGGNR